MNTKFTVLVASLWLLGLPASAVPSIANGNFTSAASWTTFGVVGNGNVLFNQSTAGILGGTSYGVIQATGGATGGTTRSTLQALLTAANPGQLDMFSTNIFSAAAVMSGVFQSFTIDHAGLVSADLQAFSNVASSVGDPFAFLINTANDRYSFVRGGAQIASATGAGAFTIPLLGLDGSTTTATGTVPPDTVAALNYSQNLTGGPTTYQFSASLNPGNYIIGFGVGMNGAASASGEMMGLAINNIKSPTLLTPEIDPTRAATPIALCFLGLLFFGDRRRREFLRQRNAGCLS